MSSIPHVICSRAEDVIFDEDLDVHVQPSGGMCSFISAITESTVVLPEMSVEGQMNVPGMNYMNKLSSLLVCHQIVKDTLRIQ